MGGVWVRPEDHGTDVPGLYAIGEASSGLHGANRLGDIGVHPDIAGYHSAGRRPAAAVTASNTGHRHRHRHRHRRPNGRQVWRFDVTARWSSTKTSRMPPVMIVVISGGMPPSRVISTFMRPSTSAPTTEPST
jgi:hypothetical protein